MDFLKKVLRMFTQGRGVPVRGFLSSFFRTTEEDYTEAEYVEIDVERNTEAVAPTLSDARTGAVIVNEEVWTENKYRPPYSAMKDPINLHELMERQPGESDDADSVGTWFGRLVRKITRILTKYHRMFARNIELQCAQALQTGHIQLTDDKNGITYDLDYHQSATHLPTATPAWGSVGATPVADITALCDVIAEDGQADPTIAVFGARAWQTILADSEFKDLIKRDGMGLGALNPGLRDKGARYMGYADFGSHRLELWVYSSKYKTLAGNTKYDYLDQDKVIITTSLEDLDLRVVFGGVPTLGMKAPFTDVVPPVVTYDGFIRVHNRVFEDEQQDTYTAESKMRALAILVSIDRVGCLTTR